MTDHRASNSPDSSNGPDKPVATSKLEEARAEIVAVGRKMLAAGMVSGSAGNLSVVVDDTMAITPSGVDYGQVQSASVCLVDRDGNRIAGSGLPSSEYPMHRLIYDRFPDVGAVVHTHSPAAVAVSTLTRALPAIHYYILRLGGADVRVADYQTFGSPELADSVHRAMAGRHAAILANHGAVAVGFTLDEAYERAELLEWLCDVWLRASAVGTPRVLTADELERVSAASNRLKAARAEVRPT